MMLFQKYYKYVCIITNYVHVYQDDNPLVVPAIVRIYVHHDDNSVVFPAILQIHVQGCGNTEMCYLSPGKLSEKSYLSGQNPTCPVFCI